MKGSHGKKDLADLTPKGIKKNATNILTGHIKRLGFESVTINDEGDPITRFAVLAKLVWDKALGYREEIKLDNGEVEVTIHKPDRGFIGMIFDRTEGRVAPTIATDDKKGIMLTNKVSEQAKLRINKIAESNKND